MQRYDIKRLKEDLRAAAADCLIQKKLWKAKQRAISRNLGKAWELPGSLSKLQDAKENMTRLASTRAHTRGRSHLGKCLEEQESFVSDLLDDYTLPGYTPEPEEPCPSDSKPNTQPKSNGPTWSHTIHSGLSGFLSRLRNIM